MTIKLKYSNKVVLITPYTTGTERDLLIHRELVKNVDVSEVLEVLNEYVSYDGVLSEIETKALLLKLREISVGEEVGIKFICGACGLPNETVLNISDVIKPGTLEGDKFEDITDDNIQEFTELNVDEMDFDEYDELKENLQKTQTKFNFTKSAKCLKCGVEQEYDISDADYISSIMSEDSVISLYQSIADLVFYGHYTKNDVDGMLPFERSIYISILNKTREELNK